jgi:hypothetical protein
VTPTAMRAYQVCHQVCHNVHHHVTSYTSRKKDRTVGPARADAERAYERTEMADRCHAA